MNKISMHCMNVAFFAISTVSGLASIVTAIKINKISPGAEPPLWVSMGAPTPHPPRAPHTLRLCHCVVFVCVEPGNHCNLVKTILHKM